MSEVLKSVLSKLNIDEGILYDTGMTDEIYYDMSRSVSGINKYGINDYGIKLEFFKKLNGKFTNDDHENEFFRLMEEYNDPARRQALVAEKAEEEGNLINPKSKKKKLSPASFHCGKAKTEVYCEEHSDKCHWDERFEYCAPMPEKKRPKWNYGGGKRKSKRKQSRKSKKRKSKKSKKSRKRSKTRRRR